MAHSRVEDGERRVRRRRRSHRGLDERIHKSRGEDEVIVEPDVEEGREIRVERLVRRTTTHRRIATASNMTSESQATLQSSKTSSSHRRQREHRSNEESTKHRRRRKSTSRQEEDVYGAHSEQASREVISRARKLGEDGESSESEEEPQPPPVIEVKPKKRKIKVVYMTEQEARARDRQRRTSAHERESPEKLRVEREPIAISTAHKPRRKSVVEAPEPPSPPKRSHSRKEPPSSSRPSLKRSNTTASHTTSHRTQDAPTIHTANTSQKRSTWMGSFFGPAVQHHHHESPVRLVECLTCLSDDIPVHKSAKLKCGHRMCHSCLKRIFKLSVVDPQHMPPKCCTSDHIPLKHVEKLFDNSFKRKWNLKFQEYTTKNRIYCPARRCGEWIKPGNIHTEGGRKYGKCGRCKTKVCCLCNCKWHGSRDCPKDEETNRLLETAKQAGWQRCYNCRTMVELKEGCNHMTCRCMAEFCMICGLKWKSCNCPWFNYDTVENDRLNHMRVPEDIHEPADQRGHREAPGRLRRPRPVTYYDEINQRQRQERLDEALARRLQTVAIEDDDDDYQGGIGEINGIGNNAGHFMNQDYVRAAHNILTGAFDQVNATANYVIGVNRERRIPPEPLRARRFGERYPMEMRGPQVPPMLRRSSLREQTEPARPVERVVPRRIRTDYASEAAAHAPIGRAPPVAAPEEPRHSVLAGLGGSGRGGNRVSAWRSHVEPGVTPAEGVLSVVE